MMMELVLAIKELEGSVLYLKKSIFLYFIIISILGLLFTFTSNAHTYKKMDVEIIHPWCVATLSGGNSNAYITISNDSNKDIELIGISSDFIKHIMLMKNGKSIEKISISADGGIRGEDDFSIMFHSSKKDLVSGENIPAILKFSSGMTIDIKFVIGENTTLDEKENTENTQEHHDHSNH